MIDFGMAMHQIALYKATNIVVNIQNVIHLTQHYSGKELKVLTQEEIINKSIQILY